MIGRADTIGVFQIESRAQMSMLPRLRPRNFYDLVIEVAIVRPGPIQGGMVHPYLRRRDGLEPVSYPSPAVESVLRRTLGVPLFQEQVMRLAMVAAGFTPGEADQLRRAMAAWKRGGQIQKFQIKLIEGMLANGYSRRFAEQLYTQIQGFGEYGFPESHAASFALLVYASAWLKRYHPAAFCAAMLNSQPLGFYTPGQLIRDAIAHGVEVLRVDICHSQWDCTLESTGNGAEGIRDQGTEGNIGASPAGRDPSTWGRGGPAIRLGLRIVRGLSEEKLRGLIAALDADPSLTLRAATAASRPEAAAAEHVLKRMRRNGVSRETLLRLAAADAFRSLGLSRRAAIWQILSLSDDDAPLLADLTLDEPPAALPAAPLDETVVSDYDALGFSLNAHPMSLVRAELDGTLHTGKLSPTETHPADGKNPKSQIPNPKSATRFPRVIRNAQLRDLRNGRRVAVAGLVTVRQRPSTAKGITFMTLEDETGMANLIIRPEVWERNWRIARTRPALIAEGLVERQGDVVHVMVRRMHDLTAWLTTLRHDSRDFC
jgi:error-prone DNA polymerase